MDNIAVSVDERIMHVRLDRPEKKNAITLAMYDRMREAFEAAEAAPDVRVVLLTGTGDAFTGGNDLKDFLRTPPTGSSDPSIRFLHTIREASKPVVAAVNGMAIGIGTTMLLHCDLVYAAEGAQFRLPFVNLALVPEAGSSYLLPRLVGHQRAAELLMLGEPFEARHAMEAGFVNRVVPLDDLADTALAAAKALAAKPPEALRHTKELLRRGSRQAVHDAMTAEGEQFIACLQSDEAKTAMEAMLGSRSRGS